MQLKPCQKEREMSSEMTSLNRKELSLFNFLTGPSRLEVGHKSKSRGETAKCSASLGGFSVQQKTEFQGFFARKIIFL